MGSGNRKSALQVNTSLVILATIVALTIIPTNAMAKSLYVIADKGRVGAGAAPIHAYNIEADGTVTFQAEHLIDNNVLGAVGITIDTDAGYLFITYEGYEEIVLVNPITMQGEGSVLAPGAQNLAGIVYDHEKGLLYCVDRRTSTLYVYNWEPEAKRLTQVPGSPFTLRGATAYGIALDEIKDLLYVANGTNEVTVYSTSDWALVDTITLDRVAISVAVGVVRGFLYTGGGFAGNQYLTQYDLATGTVREVQVEPDAGVMGLGVDPATGYIYLTTGMNNAPGGDHLIVYDTRLNRIGIIPMNGDPTGLVVPGRDIGYNPLNLRKTLIRGANATTDIDDTPTVGVGVPITYGIHFDNTTDFIVTSLAVTDRLPEEVTFITADDDGVSGHYDPETHTYEWLYPSFPPGTSTDLELTVEVNRNVETGTIITNTVTASSDQTAPMTRTLNVLAESHSLNLTKRISGVPEGKVAWVDAGEPVTYTICFDNTSNDFPVTNVSVVDHLPDEVRFVSLGADTPAGKYDAAEHTYTWSFPSLATGETICLDVNVQVNTDVDPGTTITNSVTVDSSETPASTASVEAITYQNPLNVTKRVSGVAEGQVAWVDVTEPVTYTICFGNKDNALPVTNVSVVDHLPDEVQFVGVGTDTPVGNYDAKNHTYTWLFASLDPGETVCLEVTVRIDKDVEAGTTITNTVTVDSNETPDSTESADATTYQNPLNLTKRIPGVPEGKIPWVDAAEPIAYRICFDNKDNDFPVTNVSVVDHLPEEVQLVGFGADTQPGKYDPTEHTCTWLFQSLAPGETICLDMTVQVDEDVDPGTTITNTVIVDSDETPASMASVEAITYQNPLNVTKRVSGVAEGQVAWVNVAEPITYTICFDNEDNDLPVTNVSVVDHLPDEVRFVDVGADTPEGKYDAVEHTYTWSFPSLAPGEMVCLDVIVQVEKGVAPGTTITNTVTIDSDETPDSTTGAEATTYQKPLNLTKRVLGTPQDQTAPVSADGPVTYIIKFENNYDFTVTNVSVFDTLPEEVSFVSAEEDTLSGHYDPLAHTYTWSFSSLAPGDAVRLELSGHVNQDLVKDTVFTNTVTVESEQTLPSTATADAVVSESIIAIQDMKVLPQIIRRTDQSYSIQISVILPEGIEKKDIRDVFPTLYPGAVKAKRQIVYSSPTRVKVIALFDKAELLEAVPDNGQVTVRMIGTLTLNRLYSGEAIVYITKYTGR